MGSEKYNDFGVNGAPFHLPDFGKLFRKEDEEEGAINDCEENQWFVIVIRQNMAHGLSKVTSWPRGLVAAWPRIH